MQLNGQWTKGERMKVYTIVGSSGGKIVNSGKWCLWKRSAGKLKCIVCKKVYSQAVKWCT